MRLEDAIHSTGMAPLIFHILRSLERFFVLLHPCHGKAGDLTFGFACSLSLYYAFRSGELHLRDDEPILILSFDLAT
jgi:hypothetical protein